MVKPEDAARGEASNTAVLAESKAVTSEAESCNPQENHTDAEAITTNEAALPQTFRWWPHSVVIGVMQAAYLAALLWFGDADVCPELPTIYVAAFFFFIFTGIRYGWFLFRMKGQSVAGVPAWQNPGYIALAALVINFAIVMPLISHKRSQNASSHWR